MAARFVRVPARKPAMRAVQPRDRPAGAEYGCRVAHLLTLQRQVGNAAVARLVARARARTDPTPTAAGPVLLQRAPAFGLGTPQATNEFAKVAVKWWRKYPGTTFDSFALILVEEANRFLEKIGVPAVELDDKPSTGVAVFSSGTWTIGVNAQAAGYTANTRIGSLKPDELADVANTFFHEARHAEQRFLRARLAVSKSPGKDAKAIAAEVGTKENIAAAAIKAGGGLSRGEKELAERLTEFAEKHVGYKMWITRLVALGSDILTVAPHPGPSGIDAITTAWTALAPKIDDVRKEVPAADKRIESLVKQTNRTAVDEQVLRDIRKMRDVLEKASDKATVLAKVVADWQKMKASKTTTADATRRVEIDFELGWLESASAARDVFLASHGAYERYPEEADSRVVGEAVGTAALRAAKTP